MVVKIQPDFSVLITFLNGVLNIFLKEFCLYLAVDIAKNKKVLEKMKELLMSTGIQLLVANAHEPIHELPGEFSFPELSGSQVMVTRGEWGEVYIQEYAKDYSTIRYSIFNSRTQVPLEISPDPATLHAIIVLKGEFLYRDNLIAELKEGQFRFLHASIDPVITLDPGCHISFEVIITKAGCDKQQNFYDGSNFNANSPMYVSEQVRELIRYVLSYDGPAEYRETYFHYKARDIVFQLFLLTKTVNEVIEDIPADQVDKAWAAERLIMQDLTNHLLIRELSRKVQTSETILKRAFKKVFGMGMHEYLVYQRLIKANSYLQDGCSVKETAACLGWRSADLIKAYYKKYGTTPGTVRRKATGY